MANPNDPWLKTRVSLIRRLQDLEDQAGWQTFFDLYWKLIYGVARKSGLSDAEAQDVVQLTMTSVAKHMPRFEYDPKIGSFKAWLLTKARWCIIDLLRKRLPQAEPPPNTRQEAQRTDIIDGLVDPASQAMDALWEKEWMNNLLEAASINVKRRLDPQMYQIFDFYVNKEWPPAKVAEKFSVSIENVYVIKNRVTALLKKEVSRLEKSSM